MADYVQVSVPVELRDQSEHVVHAYVCKWLEEHFDSGNAPRLMLVGKRLHEQLSRTCDNLEISKFYVAFRKADDGVNPWGGHCYWLQNLHPKVVELTAEVALLREHIKRKQAVWQEAERIKRIYHGDVCLELNIDIPGEIVPMPVDSGAHVLSEQQTKALLVHVKSLPHTLRFKMYVERTLHDDRGYNHAFMEALNRLSGELLEVFKDHLQMMVHKLVKDMNADRDSRADPTVA